jgi:prophage regulatory protein
MSNNTFLPETGFVRLPSIIGPGRPIPVSKSTWWEGIRSGRYPKPVKLGPRITAWRVEDIRALIEAAANPASQDSLDFAPKAAGAGRAPASDACTNRTQARPTRLDTDRIRPVVGRSSAKSAEKHARARLKQRGRRTEREGAP